ncbi:MAG: hypothetical protein BWK79_18605, partial [Beggiatoa sp. IS2]
NYQLVFAPELGINPAEFVAEWNNSPECRKIAEAKLNKMMPQILPTSQVDFSFKEVTVAAIVLAIGIHLVAGDIHEAEFYNQMKDKVKELVFRQSPKPLEKPELIDVEIHPGKDGTVVIVKFKLPPSEE